MLVSYPCVCKHVYTHEYTHVCKYNVHLCVCLFVRPRFLAIVDKQFFFDHFVCLSTADNGDGKGISVRSPCVSEQCSESRRSFQRSSHIYWGVSLCDKATFATSHLD